MVLCFLDHLQSVTSSLVTLLKIAVQYSTQVDSFCAVQKMRAKLFVIDTQTEPGRNVLTSIHIGIASFYDRKHQNRNKQQN